MLALNEPRWPRRSCSRRACRRARVDRSVVAAPAPSVRCRGPRPRRGSRAPAPPSSVRPRPRTSSRAGVEGAARQRPRPPCSSSVCRARAQSAALVAHEPRPRPPCRRGRVLASSVWRSSSVSGARGPSAAPWPRSRRARRVFAPSVPRARRPSAAAACPRRACGVLASMEPRPRPVGRARRPSAACPRRGSGRGRARARRAAPVARVPPCLRRECRGCGARRPSAAPVVRERPCSSPACRRGVLAPREPSRSRRACGGRVPVARVPPLSPCPRRERGVPAAVTRLRRACGAVAAPVAREPRARGEGAVAVCPSSECGRARRPSAAAVRSRRSSRVPASIEPRCGRGGRGCVLASSERPRLRRECRARVAPAPSWRARAHRAALPPSVPRSGRRGRARVACAVCSCRWSGRGVPVSRVPPCPSPVCGAVAPASTEPPRLRRGSRRRVLASRVPPCSRRGSCRPRPRTECRRASDEGAVRWCRGRRVRMVDVPSPSVPH